jgi:hypothetical protein
MPILSVVMPVYNQERYLSAAIESILNQTFKDFEFIIVNDGSTDGTAEILRNVSDARVRVVSIERVGFLKALETGVREAKGKWVARMDSDDISAPDRLERQLEFLHSHPECLFVACVYGIITPNDKLLAPRSDFNWQYLEPEDITLATQLFADPSAVFDREQALAAALYDPDFENEKPLWYRLLRRGRGSLLGEPLHFIRWRLGSHSRSDFQARTATNRDIRLRYHPEGAHLEKIYHFRNNRTSSIRAAARCIDLYILAGDTTAARQTAFDTWRNWPVHPSAVKLLAIALLQRRSLRFWHDAEPKFFPLAEEEPRS